MASILDLFQLGHRWFASFFAYQHICLPCLAPLQFTIYAHTCVTSVARQEGRPRLKVAQAPRGPTIEEKLKDEPWELESSMAAF